MNTKQKASTVENEAIQLISENIDVLKILLSGSKDEKPLKYKFQGKRGTKTIFMSIKLQYLINEYCIQNDIKIGDVIETAIVEFLLRHDYTDKLKSIMSIKNIEGDEGDN